MSDLLEFIRLQSTKGYDDYFVLQSTVSHVQNNIDHIIPKQSAPKVKVQPRSSINMRGGSIQLTEEEARQVVDSLKNIDKNVDRYNELMTAATSTDRLFDSYDTFEEIVSVLDFMKNQSQEQSNDLQSFGNDLNIETLNLADIQDQDIASIGEEDSGDTINKRPSQETSMVQVKTYDVLSEGQILYHPSTEIKRFGDATIFVKVNNVLDKTKQRSFVMFFTPNEEYARRFSGMWSLNKRPVYVHKFRVKREITGVKIIDANMIPDDMENTALAQGMCGPSEDGVIHGIKVSQPLQEDGKVDEFYICNPEEYMEHLETWMQFGSTEWVKITRENTKTIKVPENNGDAVEGADGADVNLGNDW